VQPVSPIPLGEDWNAHLAHDHADHYQNDIFLGAGDQFGRYHAEPVLLAEGALVSDTSSSVRGRYFSYRRHLRSARHGEIRYLLRSGAGAALQPEGGAGVDW